jgi:FdhE protein
VTEVIQPGEIRPPAQEAPFARSADRKHVFRRRADRLLQLANGHPLEPFLMFMAQLAQAQQAALDGLDPSRVAVPPDLSLAEHRRLGEPVFPAAGASPPHGWRDVLELILNQTEPSAPGPTRSAIAALRESDAASLDAMARAVLQGDLSMADPAQTPLVAAAVQVYWTHLASALPVEDFGTVRSDPEPHPGECPVCGSAPVASIVHVGGAQQGLRYLHCSLCETEWHLVRVKCSTCGTTTGLEYVGVEGDKGAVKAETCGECRSYLKIFYMDKDLEVEAVADDLASLGLDLLLGEEDYLRSGPSLFFVPGEAAASN